jgi:DNA-directed RNA polymerase III subunit RPC8
MFVLVEVADTFRLPPPEFESRTFDFLRTAIQEEYANRVLSGEGLCIGLFHLDSTHVSPQYVGGDGGAYVKCTFRLIVFRPIVGEVLIGRIRACDASGMTVSLGFFDDVFISSDNFQQPAQFDPAERLWMWRYQNHDLYMDLQHTVRFRVLDCKYSREPPAPAAAVTAAAAAMKAAEAAASGVAVPAAPVVTLEKRNAAMRVVGTIAESGLGLLAWWSAQ